MPEVFQTTTTRPGDFDEYWDAVLTELDGVPAAPVLDPNPIRSTALSTCSSLYLTSIGPYRLYAYYSVPHGDGPFPAILHTPSYASVVTPAAFEERQRYVSMSLCARGQRLSDKPFAASFPGLAVVGIEEASTYVYRAIVADTVRAIDFLLGRREVNARQIMLAGGDTALVGAALRPSVSAVIAADPAFYAVNDLGSRTDAYPQEEWNEYRRFYPSKAVAMADTLRYFDPLFFAPRIKADVRLSVGPASAVFNRATAGPLAQAIAGKVDVDERTGYGHLDYRRMIAWRDGHLG
ncbi:MAG: acetylxylan esterase [Chloroflexota bacterium]